MLDEKTMVTDALNGVNGELVRFGEMITHQVAREKSYYVPASKASTQEVQHVKSVLTGGAMR